MAGGWCGAPQLCASTRIAGLSVHGDFCLVLADRAGISDEHAESHDAPNPQSGTPRNLVGSSFPVVYNTARALESTLSADESR